MSGMDHPRAVMLFAAGFGTRMGDLTRDRPKPLIRVGGRALFDHALDLAEEIRPERIVANAHYRADMLAAHLDGQGVTLSVETPEILDTGGGLRAALPHLGDGPVFTLNTDAIWAGPNPLRLLREAWRPDEMDALLICLPPDRALGHAGAGDFTTDEQGRIARGPGLIYGGAQIIRTDALAGIDETAFSLNRLWDRMIAGRRAFALTYPGHWCDVGRPEGIALAETLLERSDV